MIESWRDDPRVATNPVFNANRMKLGVFGVNGAVPTMTTVDAPVADWPTTVATVQIADHAGFEALVPYARWRGYVEEKPGNRSGIVLDCSTWAAGVSQLTRESGVFSTLHVPTIHPLAAAKQGSTIDRMSAGRFGLNVVAGWNRPELEMFGAGFRDHADRYAQADEWLEIVKRLWTSEEAFDHEGKFYSVKGGISLPRPLQSPLPPIMNAGGSDRGLHFAAKNSDLIFIVVGSEEADEIRAQVEDIRRIAWDEYSRDIQIWTFAYVVQRDSRREAEEYLDFYSVQHGDDDQLDGWMKLSGLYSESPTQGQQSLRARLKAGNGGYQLLGTAEQIATQVDHLSRAGLDGCLLAWVDPVDGINRWVRDVAPLLEQAGLRGAIDSSAIQRALQNL